MLFFFFFFFFLSLYAFSPKGALGYEADALLLSHLILINMHMLQLQLQRQYPCGSHGGDVSDDAVATNQTENPLRYITI